jgi:hypothetical protein
MSRRRPYLTGLPNRQIAPMVGMNEHTVAQ